MKLSHLPSVLLFIMILQPNWLKAEYYDTNLLTIFSKILPRIVALSSLHPAEGTPITICIVHEKVDGAAARRFETLLEQNNAHPSGEHTLQSVTTDFAHLDQCTKSQIIFLFDTQTENLLRAIRTAREQKAILASYSAEILRRGSDLSLFVGRSVKPYLNFRTLREKTISIDSHLLRVSKIYSETDMP